MTFKEQLQEDEDIFINADEFAEDHEIQGKTCRAVVEGLTLKESLIKTQAGSQAENYGTPASTTRIIHCKKTDLDEVPEAGIRFTLDGMEYTVKNANDELGIVTIELENEEI
mgnify:CR=1 FL=1